MSTKQKKTIQKGSFKRLLKLFFFKNKMLTALMLFSIIISAVATALGPQYLGYATDSIVQDMSNPVSSNIHWDRFFFWAGISSVIFLIQFVSKWLSAWFSTRIISDTAKELRSQVETKLWSLPLNYFDTNSHGDIMSRTTNDIDNVVTTLNSSGADTIYSIFQLVGMIVMMTAINWRLALITVIIIPVSGWIVTLISRFVRKEYQKQWYYTGMINSNVEESVNGHNIVKLYGQEEKFVEAFRKQNRLLYESSFKAMAVSNLIQPLSRFFTNLNYVIVALGGALRVISGQMTVGDVQAFIQYTRQFQTPFSKLSQAYSSLQSGIASLDRIYELLDSEDQAEEKPEARESYRLQGKIDFRDVSFSYVPERKLIEHMNLVVEPGQMVAIVGGTGAGKTTLVKLLMGLYPISGGKLMVDGVDIREYDKRDYQRHFGAVFQDLQIFSLPLSHNVLMKEPENEEERALVVEALEKAQFADVLEKLPDGINSMVTKEFDDKGFICSGGQAQKIAIARVFAKKPDIVILDEPSSALDPIAEFNMYNNMLEASEGRTVFFISHRLSSARIADRIYFLEHGRIVEQGSHDELMQLDGKYAEMFRLQARNYKDRGEVYAYGS